MQKFKALGIEPEIIKMVEQLGYSEPTEIQEKTIPLIIAGKHVIAQSATGTGKTFAFLAGIMPGIRNTGKAQALILTPTRELANQIYEEARVLAKFKPMYSCVVFGGTGMDPQTRALKHADVVIATPGRILDHMKRGNIKFNDLKYLILDEADRMCDMGFLEDMRKIIEQTPIDKQMILFSATISDDIAKIEKRYMAHAQRVVVNSFVDATKLLQEYYKVKSNNKISLLIHLLRANNKKSIVFCNMRSGVDLVYHNLQENKIDSYRLHGGLEQNKRSNIIKEFLPHKNAVLVTTDVAARGIHIPEIEYIYNFDLPKDMTQYIHRIGRTARAGKDGKAISLISANEVDDFLRLCNKNKFKPVLKEESNFKQIFVTKPIKGSPGNPPRSGGFDSRRPSFNRSSSSRPSFNDRTDRSHFSRQRNSFSKDIPAERIDKPMNNFSRFSKGRHVKSQSTSRYNDRIDN